MSDWQIRLRIWLLQAVVVLIFGAMTAQLWRLQILEGNRYQQQALENRIHVETVAAPRGVIYDRQGRIVVRNRPSFRASLLPAQLIGSTTWKIWSDSQHAEAGTHLRAIAESLSLPFPPGEPGVALQAAFAGATGQRSAEQIEALCKAGALLECFAEAMATAPFRPVTLQEALPPERAFTVMERNISLPGLSIQATSQREYLYGPLYAHLLGYELPITQAQLDQQTRFSTNRYEASDRVGAAGIEAGYEEALRGRKGLNLVEQNVVGERVRVTEEQAALPGHNLFLTIDTQLQQAVTDALQEGLAAVGSTQGVAIALNPNSGELLAMVSLPTYDNNAFVGTIDPTLFQSLNEDPLKPMFNRAVSGLYPAGSIFKMIPAAGALADGIIVRDTTINDPGRIRLPNENIVDDPALALELGRDFVCWLDTGHGDETVVEALAHSCDVFFYVIAGGYLDQFRGLGIAAMDKWASAFGLGELTRIRLPGEAAGLVPNPRWKRIVQQASWVTGDTYNLGIGQGDLLVTPLQMVNVTAAIANGGTLYEPQLVFQVQDEQGHVVQPFEPHVLRSVPISLEVLQLVREGMYGATSWDDGTARLVFQDFSMQVAGKTGTAEYCPVIQNDDGTFDCKLDADGNQLTHAWFTAFAPYEKPEIALIVFVQGNNETVIQGSEAAAPIARRILESYFTQRPLDPAQPVVPVPTPLREATATPLPFATWTPQPLPQGLLPTVPTAAAPPAAVPPAAAPPAAAPPPTVAPPPPTSAPPPPPTLPPPSQGRFVGYLLRTEAQASELSVVTGRVVDIQGSPVAGATITLDGGGAVVATLTTGPDGSFRYDLLNAAQATSWFVRAPGLRGAPVVLLPVAPREQYAVIFQEEP